MSLNLLDHFLLSQLSAFLFVFCRVGAALMVMPAFGDSYVSPRIRLLFAMAMSAVLVPLLAEKMPPLPASTITLGLILVTEVLVGAFIGMIARTLLSVLHVAGTMIAYQSSLAVSSIFDPVTGAQTAVISNFLTITAITMMLALNLHHYMLASIVESYAVFTPGNYPLVEDMFRQHLKLVSDSFTLGVMLAAPHIVFSLLFYLMGGIMARLMPNFQIFFVMMSPQILIAFLLMLAILPMMIEAFTNFARDQLLYFAGAL
jgi:flagellar biosynthetic protein FliR